MQELKLGDIIFISERESFGAKLTRKWHDIRFKERDSFNPTHVAIALGDQSVIVHSLKKKGVQLGTTTHYAKKSEYLKEGILVYRCKEISNVNNINKRIAIEEFLLYFIGYKYNLKVPVERKSKGKLFCSELAALMLKRFTSISMAEPEKYLPKPLLQLCRANNFELVDINLGYFNRPKSVADKYEKLLNETFGSEKYERLRDAFDFERKMAEILDKNEKNIITYYKIKKQTAEIKKTRTEIMELIKQINKK